MQKQLHKLINEAENKEDLYKAPRFALEDIHVRAPQNTDLRVMVLAAPCNGFGDVVFATKFARYLRFGFTPRSRPYSHHVTIVTTTPNMFTKIGVTDISIVPLLSESSKRKQCRRMRNFTRPPGLPRQDLIFIAPLMSDFEISYSDIHAVFSESTPFNTLFLSEYNDIPEKGFDLTTGIGKYMQGLLFDGARPDPRPADLGKAPFAVMYIAQGHGIFYCATNFAKMVVRKYSKSDQFQLVAPWWLIKKLAKNTAFLQFARGYFGTVLCVSDKKEAQTLTSTTTRTSGTLVLRGDIFPVSRPKMLSLMKYSVEDILVTGDQSVTDVIDCCDYKIIWYQVVPWKVSLAQALATAIPQKFLDSTKTACGTLKRMRMTARDLSKIKREWDFRTRARPILDAAFRAVSEAQNPGSIIARYFATLSKTTKKAILINVCCNI